LLLPGRKLLEALKGVEELFARAAKARKVSCMLEAAAPELKCPAFIPLPQLLLPRFLSPPLQLTQCLPQMLSNPFLLFLEKNARFGRKAVLLHQ
jgi:hypothetical protein